MLAKATRERIWADKYLQFRPMASNKGPRSCSIAPSPAGVGRTMERKKGKKTRGSG